MSTRGVAHHQRGTFPQIDSDADASARKARYAARDAAYRAALRLGADEPIPAQLGMTVSGGGRFMAIAGGRVRSRGTTFSGL